MTDCLGATLHLSKYNTMMMLLKKHVRNKIFIIINWWY